jgi:hypothetical protein
MRRKALLQRCERTYTEDVDGSSLENDMTTTTVPPVTVTPDAAARLAELGLETEVDQILEHARQVLPELARIEVVRIDRYDMGGEPGIAVEAYGKNYSSPDAGIFWKLADWMATTFPPAVLEHVSVDYHPGDVHAR